MMPPEIVQKVVVTPQEGGKDLGEVSVSVAGPSPSRVAIVIAHGAGGNMNTPLLVDVQNGLAELSYTAVRFNFLYSENKRRSPDQRPSLEACWRSVADWVRRHLEPDILFLGGKSLGGRMVSYLAADGYPCRGIFFLGYPLHPPGKTDQLRRDHLPRIPGPMYFVQGTRDSLCELDLLKPILEALGSRATLHLVDGGDHSFNLPKRMGRSQSEVTEEIVGALSGWIDSVRKR